MTKTHAPIITAQEILTILLILCLVILLKFKIIRQFPGIVTLSLLISAIGALNHRIISGLEVQSWHYQIHVIPQVTILSIVVIIAEVWQTYRKIGKGNLIQLNTLMIVAGTGLLVMGLLVSPSLMASHLSSDGILSSTAQTFLNATRLVGGILGGIALMYGVFRMWFHSRHMAVRLSTLFYVAGLLVIASSVGMVQYHLYYGFIKPHFGYIQQLAPVLKWLNTHTEKESVIVCSIDYTTPLVVIPIYTHNNLYIAPLASCYPVPPLRELIDRAYTVMYLMGITTRQDFYSYFPGEYSEEASFEAYQNKLNQDLYTELTRYRADYIFYGPLERASFRIAPEKMYPFLHEVYHDDVVSIYRIIAPESPLSPSH